MPPDFKDHAVRPPRIDPQIGWLRCHRNIEAHLAAGTEMVLRVREEDLIAGATETLEMPLRGLGLDPHERSTAPGGQAFAGYGPPGAPYGPEPDLLEPLPPALIAKARAGARLDAALPWRDGALLAPEVVELAARYGYA